MLKCPTDGFSKFYTYRAAFDDEVEIILQRDDHRMEGYLFDDIDRLKLWMKMSGVHTKFIDRFVDLIWNFRLLEFDLGSQRLSIPKRQKNPLEKEEESSAPPFRFPRSDPRSDPFDPLQQGALTNSLDWRQR